MKARSLVLALVLVLALIVPSVIQAQDIDTCFGLSESDCEVLNKASGQALMIAENFTMNYGIDLTVTGTPDGDLVFNHTGVGPVAIDATAEFPLSMNLMTDTSFDIAGEADSGAVPFVIYDGILYIQVDEKWGGVNLIEMMNDPEFADQFGMLTDPEALADQFGGDMPEFDEATQEKLMALLSIEGFLNQVRNGDMFEFTVDLGTLIRSPQFSEAITELAAVDESGMAMGVGMLLPMVLQNGVIQVNQRVNSDLGAVDRIEVNIDATINGAMLDPELEEPIVVDFSFWVELSALNDSPVSFEVPADVEMMDPNDANFGF
ncbi:MAG: hypothetical protein H6670_16305 [Anaerolineaceae bacterium]|nr:hypothetical protein [Anaerolineaceae bacterium]